MLIRIHPAMTVLYTSRQTTLRGSKDLTATAIRELYQYVVDLDLLICGPQYRFYEGMDGRPNTLFRMGSSATILTSVASDVPR